MRRFAIAVAIASAVLSSPASAQAPAVVGSSWTGLYVGGHAGAAWLDSFEARFAGTIGAIPMIAGPFTQSGLGAVGGGHLGYNWQFNSNWLVGVEGDWSFASLSGGNTIANGTTVFVPGPVILGNSLVNARADVRSLASARGRLGYAASNWMLYGTGGVAWADVDYNASFTCSPGGVPAGCIGTFFAQTSLNKTHTGWVAGGGVEFKSAGSPLMLGVEYLYYGFESAQLAAPLTGVGGATGWTFNELDIHVVRARLSYKVW